MWLLALEALVAMLILVAIVWWTMFSGQVPERPLRAPTTKPDEPDQKEIQDDNVVDLPK